MRRQEGVRFTNGYAADAPCLPSRSALSSGRFGIHTGVVDHGGIAADPFLEGPGRKFGSELGRTCWMKRLRETGREAWAEQLAMAHPKEL